jgi:hypothetical protein
MVRPPACSRCGGPQDLVASVGEKCVYHCKVASCRRTKESKGSAPKEALPEAPAYSTRSQKRDRDTPSLDEVLSQTRKIAPAQRVRPSADYLPVMDAVAQQAFVDKLEPHDIVTCTWSGASSLTEAFLWRGTVVKVQRGTGTTEQRALVTWITSPNVAEGDSMTPQTVLPVQARNIVVRELAVDKPEHNEVDLFAASESERDSMSRSVSQEERPEEPDDEQVALNQLSDERATDNVRLPTATSRIAHFADTLSRCAHHVPEDAEEDSEGEEPMAVKDAHKLWYESPLPDVDTASLDGSDVDEEEVVKNTALGLSCHGCTDFFCVSGSLKSQEMLDFTEALKDRNHNERKESLFVWMNMHCLFDRYDECKKCGSPVTFKTANPSRIGHYCRSSKCRNVKTVGHNAPQFLELILHMSLHRRVCDFATDHRASKDTVREWSRWLMKLATLFNACRCTRQQGKWVFVEWDETFQSTRKHNRGGRKRKSGALTFAGGISYAPQPDGSRKIVEGVLQQCVDKSRSEVNPLLMYLTRPGSHVSTDQAAMYADLVRAGRVHSFVNHSVTFVVRNGAFLVHTNSVEGYWSVVKRIIHSLWLHCAKQIEEVGLQYQLAVFLANCGIRRANSFCAFLSLIRWWNCRQVNDGAREHADELMAAAVRMMAVKQIKKNLDITKV